MPAIIKNVQTIRSLLNATEIQFTDASSNRLATIYASGSFKIGSNTDEKGTLKVSGGDIKLWSGGGFARYKPDLITNTAGTNSVNVSAASNSLTLSTNNQVAITITTGGDVGIGTVTPSAKLDVSGTLKTIGLRVTNQNTYILPVSAGVSGQYLMTRGDNKELVWGNIVTNSSNVSALANLTDVSATGASAGQVLTYIPGFGIQTWRARNIPAYYYGDEPPTSAMYSDFDRYQDSDGKEYQKLNGNWVQQAIVKGPQGPQGNVGPQGPAGPAGLADGAIVYASAPSPTVTTASFSLPGYYAWISAQADWNFQTSLRNAVAFTDVQVAGTVISLTAVDYDRPTAYKCYVSCKFVVNPNIVTGEMKDVQIYFGQNNIHITVSCNTSALLRVSPTLDVSGGGLQYPTSAAGPKSFTKKVSNNGRYVYSNLRAGGRVYEWF